MFKFLNECRRLEWEFGDGLWAPSILNHTNKKVDFAGADYAGFDEILNGYTVQFSGAALRVDIIASNNNLIDILIITGVSVVPSNSAGLITNESTVAKLSSAVWNTSASDHIVAATMGLLVGGLDYGGSIWVDLISGVSGSTVNVNGTRSNPVDNIADAFILAGILGYTRIYGTGNYLADRAFSGSELIGKGSPASIDLNGFDFTNAKFENIDVSGDGAGSIGCVFYRCRINNLTNISAQFVDCQFSGDNALISSGASTIRNHLDSCSSYVPGSENPSISLIGTDADLQIRDWYGGIEIRDVTQAASDVSIDLSSGNVTIDSSVTAGTFKIHGIGSLIDNSTNPAVDVDFSSLVNKADVTNEVWEEAAANHVTPGTMGSVISFFTYQNKIWIDPLNVSGTAQAGTVPGINGVPTKPCLTVADANALAVATSQPAYHLLSNTVLDRDHTGWKFYGSSQVSINPNGFNTLGSYFSELLLIGNFSGHQIYSDDCILGALFGGLAATNLHGRFRHSVINDAGISLATGNSVISGSISGGASGVSPVIDFQGNLTTLALRDYAGDIEFTNMVDAGCRAEINFLSGTMTSGSTNVSGSIEVQGNVTVVDSASGGVSIDKVSSINNKTIAESVWESVLSDHASIAGSAAEALDVSAQPVTIPNIKQAWTRAVSGGSRMEATVALELGGQVISLPGTATLDITVRDAAGVVVIAQSGITPNAAGYFAVTENPYTPISGVNLASFATITNASDTYVGMTPISFPEFS